MLTFEGKDLKWDRANDDIRPIVASKQKEAGEDYWYDDKELNAFQLRIQALKNRKVFFWSLCDSWFERDHSQCWFQALEGEIPKEKLMDETLAPYKQNWIGYFSVMIVIIATIVTKFPELLDAPSIPIPDIWWCMYFIAIFIY